MTPEGDFSRVELVAHLRTPEVVVHGRVREQLIELLPETELAEAWTKFREIELRTGETGVLALESTTMVPPVDPSPPGEPRHPVTRADLELAAWLNTDDILPYDQVRLQLGDVLLRSPLGPAVWRMREIEWAMTVPPASPRPLQGIAALEAWDEAGELVDELLALADPAAAAEGERFRSATVVHQLLARIRDKRYDDITGSVEPAELAVRISQLVLSGAASAWHGCGGLHGLASIMAAQANRLVGNSSAATRHLSEAEGFIGTARDPFLRGQYYGYKAATLVFMRRLKEARESAVLSMRYYRQAGDRQWMAKQLIQVSKIDFAAGDLSAECLDRLRLAADLADSFRDRCLKGITYLNLARYQAEMRFVDEAIDTWKQIRPFEHRILELRRIGVLGIIYLAAERWQKAVDQLSVATEGMVSSGHCDGYYYRLMLALALHGAGRHADASLEAFAAANHFVSTRVDSVACVARKVLDEAASGVVASATIRCLAKAVEAAPWMIHGAAVNDV
ncbi:MAG: hypothetical protein GY856_41165 [bacterium]|nr:hypothetical protein [bacterium]